MLGQLASWLKHSGTERRFEKIIVVSCSLADLRAAHAVLPCPRRLQYSSQPGRHASLSSAPPPGPSILIQMLDQLHRLHLPHLHLFLRTLLCSTRLILSVTSQWFIRILMVCSTHRGVVVPYTQRAHYHGGASEFSPSPGLRVFECHALHRHSTPNARTGSITTLSGYRYALRLSCKHMAVLRCSDHSPSFPVWALRLERLVPR